MQNKPLTLEPYLFKYIAGKLDGASPAWLQSFAVFQMNEERKRRGLGEI